MADVTRRPANDQRSLFDDTGVEDAAPCPFCGADGPERCAWERNLDRKEYITRPKDCLASYDPATSEIPF